MAVEISEKHSTSHAQLRCQEFARRGAGWYYSRGDPPAPRQVTSVATGHRLAGAVGTLGGSATRHAPAQMPSQARWFSLPIFHTGHLLIT